VEADSIATTIRQSVHTRSLVQYNPSSTN